MPSPNRNKLNDIARASDLSDLLSHIAWTDTLEPIIENEKKLLQTILPKIVLGYRYTTPTGSPLTSEQVAALAWALDLIHAKIKSILSRGDAAQEDLKSQGFIISEISEIK